MTDLNLTYFYDKRYAIIKRTLFHEKNVVISKPVRFFLRFSFIFPQPLQLDDDDDEMNNERNDRNSHKEKRRSERKRLRVWM